MIGKKEFVALMALNMSLVALAIDAMLPALAEISSDFNLVHDNDRQLVLTILFLGLALGQLFFWPGIRFSGPKEPDFLRLRTVYHRQHLRRGCPNF